MNAPIDRWRWRDGVRGVARKCLAAEHGVIGSRRLGLALPLRMFGTLRAERFTFYSLVFLSCL